MHKQLAKKITSLVTLLFFLAEGILQSPRVYADALPLASPVQTPFDLAQFNLPPGLAYVHEKNQRSKGTVLILEDAHAQPDAQRKIEKILRRLDDYYGVRDILLEGGAGQGDALLFRKFPNRKILRETFDDYLERGELSGSMSAAVFSKNRLRFSGAEDAELYRQQIKAFFAGLEGRSEILQRLAEENRKLEVRKRQFYTQELLDLDQSLEAYEKNEGGSHAEQMAEVLERLSRLNPPAHFPLIEMVRHELSQEQAGSEEFLRHEMQNLFKQLQRKMKSAEDFKIFAQNKQAFETQEQPSLEIARKLIQWQKLKKWNVPISKDIQRRILEQRRLTRMTGPDFLKQWDAYVHETMGLYLKEAEALEVYADSNVLKFLDRLSRFELSRDDWAKIAAMDSASEKWPGFKFGFDQSFLSAQLDFYRLAERREQAFMKKIKESLRRSALSKTVVLVAGGFHTEGLQRAIQREGYSSVVITPTFSPSIEEGRYESLMRGEVSWRPYFKTLNGTVDLKTSFNRATVSQLIKRQKNAHPENRETFRFVGLKNWRDQLIRQLADEDRLKDAGLYTRWIDEAVQPKEGEKGSVLNPQGEWKSRIENFIMGLKQLADLNQLTETNLAKLFAVPAVSSMADKPFVAIPIPLTMLSSRHFETASGAVSQTGILQEGLPSAAPFVARSEVRSLERFEGYSDLKPIVQEALKILTAEYLIPPKDSEIFKTIFIDETLTGAAPVLQTGPISKLRISEEFVRAVKNHSAGPRLLARRLARFLVEQEAAQAGANAEMAVTLGLRADLLRFLGENIEEREQDLQFYHEQIFLSPGEAEFYETAQKRMLAQEVSLKSVPVSRARAAQVKARQTVLDETTQTLMTDELFLREDTLKTKFLERQIQAFETEGFFNGASADHPEAFWRYASLEFMRALVLELTDLVQDSRYQEVRQKIADKSGKPVDQIQQPIDFDLKPWQLFIKDFQDTRLGSAAMSLESLYRFLTEGVEMPEPLEPYTDRDQKIGLLLEQLGWNDPHRLFDAERMSESQKTEAVIRLIEFLAGDLGEPDENRGHRWDFETMRFEETDPVAIADLPEMNLLTSYWIASQGKNMEVSRYGFFGEASLRFTTGTLTGVHTAFYKRVQFASVLRALRRNPTAQVFASIDRTGGDEAAVQRITGNSESLELFKAEAAKDPTVASQIIFSDDLRRRASSGFLKTNLDEIFAFQNFLKQLLPSVEKLQDEETKPASRYGMMTETQAVQELGIAGLELKKMHAEFLTERRAYGVMADGSPAFFVEGGHPVLAVTVDRDQNVDHVIFFTTDVDGRILYEDHRKILKKRTFDSALDLADWLAQEESLYGIAPVERIFYENGEPVFRLRLNPEDSAITAADTIENVQMEDTGKRVVSFSVRQHKLVILGYAFAPDKTAAADWLSRGVEISPVEREVLPPKTKQKEISRKKTEFVRIHSKVSEDKTEKKEVISGIENTGLVGPKEQPSLAGDFFTMLKPAETYSSKTTVKAWWALFDQTSDPLYDRNVVERRVFYDTDYYENSESKNPYRPVLELSIYEGENIERIQSFGYDEAGTKTFSDEHAADLQEFDKDAGLDVWQKIQVTQRAFLDAEGRQTLVIELDPKNPGRVLTVKRYREIQHLEQGKKIKQWVEIRYPDTVLETINGRNFDASWSAEDWMRVLAPYELMEADVQAKGAFESARHDLLADYANKRKLLEQALVYYNQLQRGEITVDEAWIEAFDGFVQDVLKQGLRPWISDVNERPRDLARILRRTMNLMAAYGEVLGTAKESVPLRARLLTEKVWSAVLWSSADYLTAAQAILAGTEAQDVPIQSTGDFAQAVSKVLELYEDQVSPIVSAHERFLKRLGIPASNYEGNFTALRDSSPAMQAAYWAAQYLPAEYGVERSDEEFSHAVENEGASLLFKAEQTLQPLSPMAELTDVQADLWINKTAAWDNARTPGVNSWNPKRTAVSAEDAADKTELREIQDVVYEIYTLNGQQGPRSRESVSQKLYHASKLLKQEGLLVLMLPANKGLSEEGIEQIQDAYGFERVEEGVAFNEFSPEYRNEEILRQQTNPDQVAEAEDILQSQKFYVLILRKTSEITVEKTYLPKNQLGIKTFDAPVQDLEGQVMKSRTVSGEVQLGARPRIQDLVKSLTPKQLRPVKPKSRGSRDIKKTAVTHSRVDHRKSDERDFPYITSKLALLQKYRKLLFQNESLLRDGSKRQRLQSLLNRTFSPPMARIPRDISRVEGAWLEQQPLWWIEDREPQNNQWPISKMLVSKEGRQGLSVIVSGATITAVWNHTLDGKGRILYSEPRRLLKTGVVLKDENFNTLQQMEGTLYSAEPDMPAIFTRRRTVYLPVFEAYRDLESLYPAMARYPGLETWFSDDVWRSLESLIYQDPEDDEFNSLFRPFVENRDLVLKLKAQWKNAEKIEVEDADRLVQLRRLVRNLRTVTQLWGGPTFGRGQPRTRKSAFGSPQAEAKAHGITLNANPSFMSALAGAKYVQHLLEQNNGKLVMADLAAGSGALARALDKLDVKAPDPEFQYYELDLSQDYLNQKRPKRFEEVRGTYYKPVEGSVTDLPADRGFENDRFDFLTGFFIMDFLGEEESRAMFAQMNRVLKTGGEALLTLPQSWRLTPEYAEALKIMGFEIEVAPMRASHTATDAWIESIKEHYGNTAIGNQIAEEVRRMKSKQFSILRIKKTSNFLGDFTRVPLELFKLEKTDTGQRGKTTGDKPFDFGPQATHRWLEVLRWVVQDWNPQDLDAYDPAAQTVTRDEITQNIFPEIETEQALDKLYDLRAIFSSEQEAGNDYEDIADFYTYWKSGFQQFRREDVERLVQLYRLGPPLQKGKLPSLLSSQDLLRKLESRANYFSGLNAGRSESTYEHFERNQTLEQRIRERINGLQDILTRFPQTHPLTALAIPENQRRLYFFYDHFSELQSTDPNALVWSPQLISGLEWFFKTIHKPGDNALAELLENPPKGARSEVRAEAKNSEADLGLVNSNWAVMLENARKEDMPAENLMAAALRIGIAFQNLHRAGKLEKTETDQEPFETALSELKKVVPEFEDEWETRYGFPTNLPENPTDIANQLESYRLWRISSKEFGEAESFVEEWLTVGEDDRAALIRKIKSWTGNETDHYTDLRSYNRRLLIWIKFNEEIQTNFGLDLEALARIRLEFNDSFIFLNEISTLSPQIVLSVLQSILEAGSSEQGITPGSRVDLLRAGDAIFAHASSELTAQAGQLMGMGVFDMTRLSFTSLLRRYTYAFNVDLDKMGQFETQGDQAMMNGLNSGKWGAFEKLYAQEDRDSRIRRFHKLVQLIEQVQSKQIDSGRFNQLTDIMLGRVHSIVEAGAFFSKASQWKNSQARKHALTKISKKLMALMAEPDKKEELYDVFRTSVLTTLATGVILWQAEEFLSESARLDKQPAKSFFFDGKELGVVAAFIQEGLLRAEDAALTVGLMTFVTLDLESALVHPNGSLAAAARWVNQLRYQTFFEREIISGNPQMVSPIFIAAEDHLEAAKTLGQWFYRKQKITAEPFERALLWEQARHWLDLLWVRYASSEPGQSREELHSIFEAEATGQAVPEDPVEAANYLADQQLWTISDEDLAAAGVKIQAFVTAPADQRETRLEELEAWIDEPVSENYTQKQVLNRVTAVFAHYKSAVEAQTGASLEDIVAMNKTLHLLLVERRFFSEDNPSKVIFILQLLRQAAQDSRLAFSERLRLWGIAEDMFLRHPVVSPAFKDGFLDISESSPLKSFSGFLFRKGTLSEKKTVAEVMELFAKSKKALPDADLRKELYARTRQLPDIDLPKIKRQLREFNEVQFRMLLNSFTPNLQTRVPSENLPKIRRVFLEAVMDEISQRADPMSVLLALIGAIADDPTLGEEISEPVSYQFMILFSQPQHRETFVRLLRQTPSLGSVFGKFLARASGNTDLVFAADRKYNFRELFEAELRRALDVGDIPLFYGLFNSLVMARHAAKGADSVYVNINNFHLEMLRSFVKLSLTSKDGKQFFLEMFSPEEIATLSQWLGEYVYENDQDGVVRQRARHLLDLALIHFYDELVPEKQKYDEIFEKASAGFKPLPKDSIEAAIYLMEKEAEGHKIWSVTPEDHRFAEDKVQDFLESTDSEARETLMEAFKKWVEVSDDPWGNQTLSRRYLVFIKAIQQAALVEVPSISPSESIEQFKQALFPAGTPAQQEPALRALEVHLLTRALEDSSFTTSLEHQWIQQLAAHAAFFNDTTGQPFKESLQGVLAASPLRVYEPLASTPAFDAAKIEEVLRFFDPKSVSIKQAELQKKAGLELGQLQRSGRLKQEDFLNELSRRSQEATQGIMLEQEAKLRELGSAERVEFLRRWPALQGNPEFPKDPRNAAARLQWINASMATTLMLGMMARSIDSPTEILEVMFAARETGQPILAGHVSSTLLRRLNELLKGDAGREEFVRLLSSNQNRAVWIAEALKSVSSFLDVDGQGAITIKSLSPYRDDAKAEGSALRHLIEELALTDDIRIRYPAQNLVFAHSNSLREAPGGLVSAANAREEAKKLSEDILDNLLKDFSADSSKAFAAVMFIQQEGLALKTAEILGGMVHQTAEAERDVLRAKAQHYLDFFAGIQAYNPSDTKALLAHFNAAVEGKSKKRPSVLAVAVNPQQPAWAAGMNELMQEPLWNLPDEDLQAMKALVQKIFDPELAQTARASAKKELIQFVQDASAGKFRATSRAIVVNELMADHVRTDEGIVYDPMLHEGFETTVTINHAGELLEFILLRIQAAKDPRFSFPIRKDITSKLLNHLDGEKSRNSLRNPEIQAFLKQLPEDSDLGLLRILENPSEGMKLDWQSVPDYPNVTELLRSIFDQDALPILETQATNVLNELDKLLADPNQRAEFKKWIGARLFAKFPLMVMFNTLRLPGFLGEKQEARFPHLSQSLDEMLASTDPFEALNTVPMITTYAESMSQKSQSLPMAGAWEFLLGRAVQMTQSGRPFHEIGSMVITLALSARPAESSRMAVVGDFLEALLKVLGEIKDQNPAIVFPNPDEMALEMKVFAGTRNVSEAELRKVLQVPADEPLTNNRFKRLLAEMPEQAAGEEALPELLSPPSLSKDPFDAMLETGRANADRKLWVLTEADKKIIQTLTDYVYQASGEDSQTEALEKLNAFLISPNRYQEWSRRYYAFAVLRRGAVLGNYPFEAVSSVRRNISTYILTMLSGTLVFGVTAAEQIEELQLLVEGALDEDLDSAVRFYLAPRMNFVWNGLLKAHKNKQAFSKFLNEMRESQKTLGAMDTSVKAVRAPAGIEGGGLIPYEDMEGRRYMFYKLAEAEQDPSSPFRVNRESVLDALIPHMSSPQEFTDFFGYARQSQDFLMLLPHVMQRLNDSLSDPATQEAFLGTLGQLLPRISLEGLADNLSAKPLFDENSNLPYFHQTIEQGLRSENPLLAAQTLRMVSLYIQRLFGNADYLRTQGDLQQADKILAIARRQESFVLNFFETLFHDKGFHTENYDGLFLVAQPAMFANDRTGIWEQIAERAEKVMREELEQASPADRAAVLAKFDPQKTENLFTGLTGWDEKLNGDDLRRILEVAPGQPFFANRFQRAWHEYPAVLPSGPAKSSESFDGLSGISEILSAVAELKNQTFWHLSDDEKQQLTAMAQSFLSDPEGAAAETLYKNYYRYVNEVHGGHRYARALFATAMYERLFPTVTVSFKQAKKIKNPFTFVLSEVGSKGIRKQVLFFKTAHEFSQDPDFQKEGYTNNLLSVLMVQTALWKKMDVNEIMHRERFDSLRGLGEMTGIWFIPSVVTQSMIAQNTELESVQSVAELIAFAYRHFSSEKLIGEFAEPFLLRANFLLEKAEERKVFLASLRDSIAWWDRFSSMVTHRSQILDKSNEQYKNLRTAFMEAAEDGDVKLLAGFEQIFEHMMQNDSEREQAAPFMAEFAAHFFPKKPFEETPVAWKEFFFRFFSRVAWPENVGQRAVKFKEVVGQFAQKFEEARTRRGTIPRERMDQVVMYLVRFAAKLDLSYRTLQEALEVPRSESDVYDDNIFTRLAAEVQEPQALPTTLASAVTQPLEPLADESIRIVRETPQSPLWTMTHEEYGELEVYVDLILEAKSTAARNAALETFKKDMLDPALPTAQIWSRRFISYAILKEKGFREDHTLETLRETMRLFVKEVLGDDTLGATIPELFQELQLLTEASVDAAFLSPQQRYFLQVRARKTIEKLSTQWKSQGLKTQLEDIFQTAQPDNVFYYYSNREDADELPVLREMNQAYQQMLDGAEAEGKALFFEQVSTIDRVDVVLKIAQWIQQITPDTESQGSRAYAYSLLWQKLKLLLRDPETGRSFYEAAQKRESLHFGLIPLLQYAVNTEGDGLFDAQAPDTKPLRDFLLAGINSQEPRTLYGASDLLHRLTGFYVRNAREKGASVKGGILFEQFKWEAISARMASSDFKPNDLHELSSATMATYPIQQAIQFLTAAQEKSLRDISQTEREVSIRNLERFWMTWTAFSNGGQAELTQVLDIHQGDIPSNRFSRVAGRRSEVRALPTNDLQRLSEQTAGYLISNRMPPSAFLARLVRTAETELAEIEMSLSSLADNSEGLAVFSLQIPEWTDPAFEADFFAQSRRLQQQGTIAKMDLASDIVRIYTSTPQTDALIAAMKNQPNLNVYGIWQPKSFTDKPNMTAMRKQAERMEYEVNRALGALDVRARFKIVVPASRWKLERLIKESPSVLMTLKGRQDSAVVTGRIVVIYGAESSLDVGTLSELKSLRHQIPVTDKSRFAKEYLLYASASEISQEVLSQLYRAFIDGEGHFTFNDDRISADLLVSFIGMEHLIAQQFASSA